MVHKRHLALWIFICLLEKNHQHAHIWKFVLQMENNNYNCPPASMIQDLNQNRGVQLDSSPRTLDQGGPRWAIQTWNNLPKEETVHTHKKVLFLTWNHFYFLLLMFSEMILVFFLSIKKQCKKTMYGGVVHHATVHPAAHSTTSDHHSHKLYLFFFHANPTVENVFVINFPLTASSINWLLVVRLILFK